MALSCPIGLDVSQLRAEVAATYARVATDPNAEYHFHRGFEYATSRLGYDPAELKALPSTAVDSFAGVGNPLRIGRLAPGEVVVDIGCGAGTALLLAAQQVGPTGRVIGIEPTPEMRQRAIENVRAAGAATLSF